MNFNIPKPCHENWDIMNPNEKGRHCTACAKTVVDFTQMTDEEVLNYFSTHKNERICGRVKAKSTSIPEIIVEIPARVLKRRLTFMQLFLVCMLVSFGATLTSFKNSPATRAVFVVEGGYSVSETDTPPPRPEEPEKEPELRDHYVVGLIAGPPMPIPTFPGGDAALKEYIIQKASKVDFSNYPDSLKRKIYVKATIDTLGRPQNITIVKGGVDSIFNQQLINIINEMPDWEPAWENGKKVLAQIIIPFILRPKE